MRSGTSITLILSLLSFIGRAQDIDSTASTFFQFQQEGLLSNRSLWTFEDNPALAGFDRKLNLTYDYSAQNLSVIQWYDGDSSLAFQQHSGMMDLSFGGDKENFGAGIAYRHVKNGRYHYHRITWAHSYRLSFDKHNLIFGLSSTVFLSNLNWDVLSFSDSYDPRFGFIYPSSEQRPPSTSAYDIAITAGLNYDWERLVIGYSFQWGPRHLYTVRVGAAGEENDLIHHFRTGYHIRLPDDVSITPEVLIRNDRYGLWKFTPAVTINYKRIGYGQIALVNLNALRVSVGYLWNETIGINVSIARYVDQVDSRVFGLASVQAGFRFQISTRRK